MQEYNLNRFLEKLGLTEYEAKTLSALFRLKESEAPEISRSAQVPKTRVYDVLDRLTKKKAIIDIHGRPKRYMAIEPEKVFSMLLEEKRKELAELEKEADSLKRMDVSTPQDSGNEKVMKVKDKNDFMKILGQEIDSAKESVVGLAPIGKGHSIIRDSVRNAISRNVDIRLISKINEESDLVARDFVQAGASIKGFEHGINAYIIDGKKVVLALSNFEQSKPEYHFTIWPDNKPMADTIKKYFDHAWEHGKQI